MLRYNESEHREGGLIFNSPFSIFNLSVLAKPKIKFVYLGESYLLTFNL